MPPQGVRSHTGIITTPISSRHRTEFCSFMNQETETQKRKMAAWLEASGQDWDSGLQTPLLALLPLPLLASTNGE